MLRTTLLAIVAVCMTACQSAPQKPAGADTPLFKGLGDHHRTVTTSSPDAQKYFDQGLIFAFSFNHDEAIRSFKEVQKLDPRCAMAWWGIALCNGPHINNAAMSQEQSKAAWDALVNAKGLAWKCTPVEQALIGALGARYAWPVPADRVSLDRAYADAMQWVARRYPNDADIAVLYAESLMDLRPWDLYDQYANPRPETPTIVAALETAMAIDPDHPGANHLYIHAVEASHQPERALPAADRLCTLVPAAGHMVHMPAHIYIRTSMWSKAAEQNRRAIKADAAYRKISPNQGFYHVYMAHNHQFLAFGCMMQGRSKEGLASAREMVAAIPQEFIDTAGPVIDGILPLPLGVLMRFGMWDEVLEEPRPSASLPISTAIWRYSRAVALANTGRLDEARTEQEAFTRAAALVPASAKVGNSDASIVMTIATNVLAGEIAFKSGQVDEAVDYFRWAAAAEDTLRYNEPPDWLQPVRHTLGAVLLNAGRTDEAEAAYREDLVKWPENAWSLFGLAQCLEERGDPEAAEVKERFRRAWAESDVPMTTSCLCVPGK